MDNRPGRADEPDEQRMDREAVPSSPPRPATNTPLGLRGSLQLRPRSQEPEQSHSLRLNLQGLDIRTQRIHPKSDPLNAGTEHLVGSPDRNRIAVSLQKLTPQFGHRRYDTGKEDEIGRVISTIAPRSAAWDYPGSETHGSLRSEKYPPANRVHPT